MPVGTAIFGGLIAAIILAVAGGEEEGDKDREPWGPIPVPDGESNYLQIFDGLLCECAETLGVDATPLALRNCILKTLHPEVPFPPVPADDESVHLVWEWTLERATAYVEAPDKSAFCGGKELAPVPGEPAKTPFEILTGLTKPTPTPGGFYEVGSRPDVAKGDDTFSKILRDALNKTVPGAGNVADNRIEYAKLVTSGPRWNVPLYASTLPPDNIWKSYMYTNGVSLRRGWKPWHAPVAQRVAQGKYPARAMTDGGSRVSPHVGSEYALLWLPPVDANLLEQGVVVTGDVSWSDDSTVLDPPPELLEFIS